MSVLKWVNGKNDCRNFIEQVAVYITDKTKTKGGKLVGSAGCFNEHAIEDMYSIKRVHHKQGGKQGEHFVLSLTPNLKRMSDNDILDLADRIAGHFTKNQCLYAVHTDSKYRHVHFLLNSVSYVDGKKWHQSPSDLNRLKCYINNVLEDNGYDIIRMGTDEITDMNPYTIDDGFDFLEVYDDKPYEDPFTDVLADVSNDKYFDDNSVGIDANNQRKIDENQSVYTDDDYESEDYYMTNYYPYGTYPQAYIPAPNSGTASMPQTATQQSFPYGSSPIPQAENQQPQDAYSYETSATPAPLPSLVIKQGRNINFSVPHQGISSETLSGYAAALAIPPQQYVDGTKLGMAIMAKFQQQGIQANVVVDCNTNIDICFTDNEQSEIIDTDPNAQKH